MAPMIFGYEERKISFALITPDDQKSRAEQARSTKLDLVTVIGQQQ